MKYAMHRQPWNTAQGIPKRRRFDFLYVFIALGVVAIIGLIVGYVVLLKGSVREVTVNVSDKERVCESGNSECRYLFFTDEGTFENTDSLLFGKYRSSDVYGSVKVGQTYTFKVAGWRVPIFSSYPNVIEVSRDAR